MPPTSAAVRAALDAGIDPAKAGFFQRFFKTGPGEYAEGDRFLGLTVPATRRVAKAFRDLPLPGVAELLASPMHEHRLCALLILVDRHARGGAAERRAIHSFYLDHLDRVDNWDLVDLSAPALLGGHLLGKSTRLMDRLARSPVLWRRRAAMVATLAFIRAGDLGPTFRLADALLRDPHDLMHKAVGWMLREAGKRDLPALDAFLLPRHPAMPRTMLRYAIERHPERRRKAYLRGDAK